MGRPATPPACVLEQQEPRTPPHRPSRPCTASPPHARRQQQQQRPQLRQHQRSPWVVADWKHRVPTPESSSPGRAARGRSPQRRASSARAQAQQAQLSADMSGLRSAIQRMLQRCKLVERLGCRADGSSSGGSAAAPRPSSAPVFLTRSQLHFRAPPREAVDLNPGGSWRPGTPQRLTASLRRPAGAGVVDASEAELTAALAACRLLAAGEDAVARGSACGRLSCRETLRAGMQQLRGEAFGAMRKQRVGGHAAAMVPRSWFNP